MDNLALDLIVNAWRDEDCAEALSASHRSAVPSNPAGAFSLKLAMIEAKAPSTSISSGGTCDTSISSSGCCSTSISSGGTCDTSISSSGCC